MAAGIKLAAGTVFLPMRADLPPETFSFLEVHTLDFDERCGHQHVTMDEAVECAKAFGKKFRRRKPWPGVAIWSIRGMRGRVFDPPRPARVGEIRAPGKSARRFRAKLRARSYKPRPG